MSDSTLALFEQQSIRRIYKKEQHQWYFSIVDVVQVLTDSTIPKRYRSDLKKKLSKEGSEVYEKIVQLKFIAND
jgi:DNA-damage-inducible protein D